MDKEQKEHEFHLSKEIAVLYKRGRFFMDSMILKHELGSGHYSLLFFLNQNDGASQDDISKNMEIDKTTVARGLTRLEEQDFIVRRVDEKDRRVNRVFLTEKGQSVMPMLRTYSDQWESVLISNFTEEEKETLKHLITKMNSNAQSYRHNLCKKGGQHDK